MLIAHQLCIYDDDKRKKRNVSELNELGKMLFHSQATTTPQQQQCQIMALQYTCALALDESARYVAWVILAVVTKEKGKDTLLYVEFTIDWHCAGTGGLAYVQVAALPAC
jgi:hypothetical protein